MRIVFAGTPAVAVPSLRALADSTHELVGVVTRPDRRAGRGRHLQASAVSLVAEELDLPVAKPAQPGDQEFLDQLRAWRPDAAAVVAYGALLPQSALDIPPLGWINLHFSLLPAWRGAAPVQHSIWHGDEFTGATTFRIVPELDAGPVFGTMTYAIPPHATAGDVLGVLARDGAKLLVDTMDAIAAGVARAEPQSGEGTSYAGKITVAEAAVTWAAPHWAVDRQIRACTPDPGAWTTLRGSRIKLGPVRPLNEGDAAGVGPGPRPGLAAGELLPGKKCVLVGTAGRPVVLGQVAPAGKAYMDGAAWARGARIESGERFGS
ncbi:MAG: methionyl-tRNA formyltransferase [Bifidobacteriaceae bacterium]|jgi:methionyl-tRNA formyltransferase|nr:methionyl-tRNA formyltransferase [Bifidobacteriaceae bacterium]